MDQLRSNRGADAAPGSTDYVGVTAHELRNCLGALVNAARLLQLSGGGDARWQRAAGIVERQSRRADRLLDVLLSLAGSQDGPRAHLHRRIIDLSELIWRLLAELRADVSVPEPAEEATWVFADELLLSSALRSLFEEFVDGATTEPEDGTIQVSLQGHEGDGQVCLRLRGAEQNPSEYTRAVVRAALVVHGGELVTCEPGLLELRLPTASDKQWRATADAEESIAPQRVLIVEDDIDVGQSLRDLLELMGHHVSVVQSGHEALEVLELLGAETIFCDVGLPDMTGYEVARAIRESPELRSVRLVAVTAYSTPEAPQKSEDAGFDAHLVKPVALQAVREALSLAREAAQRT